MLFNNHRNNKIIIIMVIFLNFKTMTILNNFNKILIKTKKIKIMNFLMILMNYK